MALVCQSLGLVTAINTRDHLPWPLCLRLGLKGRQWLARDTVDT